MSGNMGKGSWEKYVLLKDNSDFRPLNEVNQCHTLTSTISCNRAVGVG